MGQRHQRLCTATGTIRRSLRRLENCRRKIQQKNIQTKNAIADTVKDAGFNPYEKKLLGITAMSTLLGKKKFEELLGGLIYKPPGKPTLVPESDKRPAMNTAKDDFKE